MRESDRVPGTLRLVILAAGASARLGQCKALCPLGETTPLEHLLRAAEVLADPEPLVITGPHHREISDFLDRLVRGGGPGARPVHNPRWETGRTTGVALAASLRPGAALCIAPVDVPLVPAAVFGGLLAGWQAAARPVLGWLAPCFREPLDPTATPRYGHPVCLGPDLVAQAASLPGNTPLFALRARARPLGSVEVVHREILDDLDSEADRLALVARLAAGSRPSPP